MELVAWSDGAVSCIYGEEIDLAEIGELSLRRASHVEPDRLGHWWADLSLVCGPTLGPFARRSEAVEAEVAWLRAHAVHPREQEWVEEDDEP